MNALNVIRKPIITEKSSILEEKMIYAFWVNPKSTKIDIKNAFKTLYGVNVDTVKLVTVPKKNRKLQKGTYNKRKETRKAYISVKSKNKLDLNKFAKFDQENKTTVLSSVNKKPQKAKLSKTTNKTSKL